MSKQHIIRLASIMVAKGIRQVVVSPGSRNAPAIILFGANKKLELISIPDERSAGFFALGLSLQSGHTTAILCTSGSALLNYAPAISEAYYQRIPLLVITADRPIEMIDQGDSQTIRQQNIYANYIRKSFNAPVEIRSKNDEWYFDRMINEAIDRTHYPVSGPVQVNLPLDEPLYDLKATKPAAEIKIIDYVEGIRRISDKKIKELVAKWQSSSSKLMIAGQMPPNKAIHQLLVELAADPSVVVFTECTSNLPGNIFINCIDRTLSQVPIRKNDEFKPDLLVTLGGAIVSKKVKAMLRDMHPSQHWHIDPDPDSFHFDTYKCLTSTLDISPVEFLSQLIQSTKPIATLNPVGYQKPGYEIEKPSGRNLKKSIGFMKEEPVEMLAGYSHKWKSAEKTAEERHKKYLEKLEFTDLKAYEVIFSRIPSNASIHLANSTPVRYGQLFEHRDDVSFYANRGTSGIDGCASTAAGFAFNQKGPVILITGDIAFFYDSNALWNNKLPSNLRIIVFNNGGGNIFRIIDGPAGYDELEPYIETRHHLNAEGIAANFNIDYYKALTEKELADQLQAFFDEQKSNRPAILEIFTDNKLSAQTLREYFGFLRKNIEKFES
ncbi:MAG TPA: 2-succinyl-5-enolpyruvyl-6-hydroxy-3-cyclohexene-1-carboxylic-acid synthase [Lentimicrobium sp.]|nr:2-succinyl-5-enolpyruvyl-6-hydroxy-3-cyclohexene-1-carboxylic-acid synthase [Lentimicrobium sp.]